MLHTGLEITIGQAFQLFHQLLTLAVWDVLGEQKAVDQQTQLGVGKVPHQIEVRPEIALLQLAGLPVRHHAEGLAVFDLVAAVDQIQQMPPDRLPLSLHPILRPQDLRDLLLAQPMILVRVPAKNVEDIQDQGFLGGVFHFSFNITVYRCNVFHIFRISLRTCSNPP